MFNCDYCGAVSYRGEEVIDLEPRTLTIEDLGLPDDFVFVGDTELELMQPCGICSNCCFSDCIGGQ